MRKFLPIYAHFFTLIMFFTSCQKLVVVEDISGSRMSRINNSKDKSKHLVLDVRGAEEYRAGHLDYAINIPLEELRERVGEIADLKDMTIYIYSRMQDESFPAAQILVEHGFEHLFNAEGTQEYSYKMVNFATMRVRNVRNSPNSKDFFLIDYRAPSSYQVEHFQGAVNISIGEIPNKLHLLPKDKDVPIVIYCNTGVTCAWGAKELVELGYSNVSAVLEGAIDDVFVRELDRENLKED